MSNIELEDLTKRFEQTIAVNNISLSIKEGEIFGLIGPNGAGKTTMINMISGLLMPDGGGLKIAGLDFIKTKWKLKRKIGLIPQDLAIYNDLSAYDNVKFFGSLYGLKGKTLRKSVEQALEAVGLESHLKKLPKAFSGGMKRRLNIACGIVHRPDLIIFDEPTVGIDPQSRNHILETIRELNSRGSTIIYTTHYMEEAEQLCRDIAIIDHGKIIARGTKEELKNLISDQSRLIIHTLKDAGSWVDDLKRIQGIHEIEAEDGSLIINSQRDVFNLGEIISFLNSKQIPIHSVLNDTPNLEMVFLSLTGRKLRD